eukprot:5646205-Pyramimonas_sp.AAC.1
MSDTILSIADKIHSLADKIHSFTDKNHSFTDKIHSITDNIRSVTDMIHSFTGNLHSLTDNIHSITDNIHGMLDAFLCLANHIMNMPRQIFLLTGAGAPLLLPRDWRALQKPHFLSLGQLFDLDFDILVSIHDPILC